MHNSLGQTPMHVIANSAAKDFSEAMARGYLETMEVLTETKTNPEEDYDDKKESHMHNSLGQMPEYNSLG